MVLDILHTIYPINRQKWISNGEFSRNYDAHILGTNILIEINGDYWHANPLLYNSGDLITYPGGTILVDTIWAKDTFKTQLAESYGYKVITIWEYDINCCNNIKQYLLDTIGEI